jgi:hypothetical protein
MVAVHRLHWHGCGWRWNCRSTERRFRGLTRPLVAEVKLQQEVSQTVDFERQFESSFKKKKKEIFFLAGVV